MDGKFQIMDAVYDCRITSPEPQKISFGLAEGKWKKMYYNHEKSFNRKRHSLRRHFQVVWHLKETLNATSNLKCSVGICTTPYSNISKKCLLCLCKKLVIITYPRMPDNANF